MRLMLRRHSPPKGFSRGPLMMNTILQTRVWWEKILSVAETEKPQGKFPRLPVGPGTLVIELRGWPNPQKLKSSLNQHLSRGQEPQVFPRTRLENTHHKRKIGN